MTIREQVEILLRLGVEHVIVGGQAGVLRQATEFSQDLDILIRATEDNALRVRQAVAAVTGAAPDTGAIRGRDFQQYVNEQDGTEIDVHLKVDALPDYDAAIRNSSTVDFLGLPARCLELPALYSSLSTRSKASVCFLTRRSRMTYLSYDRRIPWLRSPNSMQTAFFRPETTRSRSPNCASPCW